MDAVIARVRRLAEDVLYPAALDVDLTGTVPESHWVALAEAGLYGLAAPPESGGLGLDFQAIVEVVEVMAGGCLSTTFTWLQHHGVVAGLSGSTNAGLRNRLLADLAAGRLRGGVAFAGVIPDPPRMTATRVDGGWSLTGDGPFVSGWGIIDVVQVSAGDVETGDVIAAVIPADESRRGFTSVEALSLIGADATRTVSIRLDDLVVTDHEIASRVTRDEFFANQLLASRLNGCLALGLARRCARLLSESGQADAATAVLIEVDATRSRLDAGLGNLDTLLAARADASALALRAAGAALTAAGGPGLVRSSHAQRLVREAAFTLVAASRKPIKTAIISTLTES